jgi:translation initiation factor 2B subunit (eIF-2B alpha/beta/delta family)
MRPPLAFDSISPQTPLVAEGAAWLAARVRADGGDVPAVAGAARALADAQPAMAALVALGTRALLVAHKAVLDEAGPADRTARVLEAIETWQRDFARAGDELVRLSAEALPASGWVATFTRSSLVERALLAAHAAGRPLHVVCAESRPMNEGRGLAAALAEAGVPVWMAVDGAEGMLLPQAGALWIGADAVREKSFVAKAGTYALLLVARELSLPVTVFAQRAKFLPDRCRRLTLPRRDAAEVWPDAPRGVNVLNVPFEEVPLGLVRGVLTEGGFLGPREVLDAAGTAQVAAELLDGYPPA